MRRILSLLCAGVLIASGLRAQPQGRVELHTFMSPALGISKSYNIYLPPGYDGGSKRYPVVFFFRGHEREWFNPTEDGSRNNRTLKTIADELIDAGLIGEMILVGPSTASDDDTFHGLCVNMLRPGLAPVAGIGTGKFEDYLLQDLIPLIDSIYRTFPDRLHRGVDGFSLGGITAITLGIRHPDMFSSVGSYDGTLMWYNLDDPRSPGPLDDGTWLAPSGLVDAIFDSPRNVPYMLTYNASSILRDTDSTNAAPFRAIRFLIHTTESDNSGNHSRNLQFVDILTEKGIANNASNVVPRPTAVHNWFYADIHATESLMQHWRVFAQSRMFVRTRLDFRSVEVGQSDTMTVAVTNISDVPVSVTSIGTSGGLPEFTAIGLPSLPVTLPSKDDSVIFQVAFTPSAEGEFSDTLIVANTDSMNNTLRPVLLGAGISIARAEEGTVYAIGSSGGQGFLYTVDTTSAVATYRSEVGVPDIRGAAVRRADSVLYGVSSDGVTSHLHRISVDGGATTVATIPVSNIRAIAFGPGDTLYGASFAGGLYRIDPSSGDAALLGSTSGLQYAGLAFHPSNGSLWGSVLHPIDSIFTINLSDGAATLIGTTGFNALTSSLAFSASGTLYGLIDNGTGENYLATISTANGAGNLIGSTVAGNLFAIALAPFPGGPLSVGDGRNPGVPLTYRLEQNYPNPFNPKTTIDFSIAVGTYGRTSLRVYDLLGQEVAVLVNENVTPGSYTVRFDASGLASGIYLYRLTAGQFSQTRKMIVLR
jgi:predicted alpha/beta superfamily hydrolase